MELIPSHLRRIAGSLLALPLLLAAGPSGAQEQARLSMELNGLAQTEDACRLTFVIKNELSADIDKAVFEFALFNKSGLVERLLTLDFKSLPEGRTRVRQFDLAELQCGGLNRILVNDARECSGEAIEPGICMSDLTTTTATEIQFGS